MDGVDAHNEMKYPEDFLNKIICGDSFELLKTIPDGVVDLVITDPPYGLNISKDGKVGGAGRNFIGKLVDAKKYIASDWDKQIPKRKYFDEIFRISKNQIIFGGNYFCEYLKQGNKWVVWDKKATGNFSACELIWTSYKGRIEKFEWEWNGFIQGDGKGGRQRVERNHPSQKPIELIQWIIKLFSKENDIILDPFLGSGTTAIACKMLKRNYIGIEISPDYVRIAEDRLRACNPLL